MTGLYTTQLKGRRSGTKPVYNCVKVNSEVTVLCCQKRWWGYNSSIPCYDLLVRLGPVLSMLLSCKRSYIPPQMALGQPPSPPSQMSSGERRIVQCNKSPKPWGSTHPLSRLLSWEAGGGDMPSGWHTGRALSLHRQQEEPGGMKTNVTTSVLLAFHQLCWGERERIKLKR